MGMQEKHADFMTRISQVELSDYHVLNSPNLHDSGSAWLTGRRTMFQVSEPGFEIPMFLGMRAQASWPVSRLSDGDKIRSFNISRDNLLEILLPSAIYSPEYRHNQPLQ